jgi:ankyrin repeat protein
MPPHGAPQHSPDEPDYEWIQQQLAAAHLCDEDEDDGWQDPTPDALLTEALEASELGDAARLRGLVDKLSVADLETAGPDGDTALHLSALYGRLECMQLLLEKGCSAVQANEEDGATALHNAAAGGYLECVQALLERCSDAAAACNAADEDGETALHTAARGGHRDVVALLLQKGADPRLASSSGATPLDEAESEEVVQALEAAAAAAAPAASAAAPAASA